MATWLTPEQVAKMTGLTLRTLANLRSEHRRFPFYRVEGSRSPLYKKEEIDQIISASKIKVRP